MNHLRGCSYIAARDFLPHLLDEVPGHTRIDGELVSDWTDASGPDAPAARKPIPYWIRNAWLEPFLLEFGSISEAAATLRAIQRNWAPWPVRHFRRMALISEALPHVNTKPKAFPFALPKNPMGGFTLLDEHLLLGSARCSSPFPNGEFQFVEDREGPPSRAYRKLWEALVLAGEMPGPGDFCLDAGASPGGWTWALAGLGARVLAVDRALLDPGIAAMPGVSSMRHDAFTLKPKDLGPVDWLCSDVICYPEALLGWIRSWMDSGLAKNFICTIKMQGEGFDRITADQFAAIPGSRVLHLWHNKHELTWINLQSWRTSPSSSPAHPS